MIDSALAALIGLFDLLAARFSITVFTQIINRPGHIAFIAVLGMILAVGAFFRPLRLSEQTA